MLLLICIRKLIHFCTAEYFQHALLLNCFPPLSQRQNYASKIIIFWVTRNEHNHKEAVMALWGEAFVSCVEVKLQTAHILQTTIQKERNPACFSTTSIFICVLVTLKLPHPASVQILCKMQSVPSILNFEYVF